MDNNKQNIDAGAIVADREKQIVKTSIVGIVVNICLAGFKAFVGLLTHSIAITLDAVNNLSDALSSIITVIGTKLAGRSADYKHPYGYGRIEYLSAMIISVIIMYAGVTAFIESIKKIMDPVTPDYTTVSLIIVAVAVVTKVFLGRYVQSVGKRVNSASLEASGKDALMDSVISASTLLAAGIFLIFGISLEAYLGAVIALVIIKAGIDVMRETISQLLGERVDKELSVSIKRFISNFDEDVHGAYDLTLHNYGPDIYLGSVHIEVPDSYSIEDLDDLTRRIMDAVYAEFNVILTAVSIYASNTDDKEKAAARSKVSGMALSHEFVKGFHGFFISDERKFISFDVVVKFEAPDMSAICDSIKSEVEELYPGYFVRVNLDVDMSD